MADASPTDPVSASGPEHAPGEAIGSDGQVTTIRPLRAMIQVIAGEYDTDGNLIGEYPAGEMALYAPHFAGRLKDEVEREWSAAVAHIREQIAKS